MLCDPALSGVREIVAPGFDESRYALVRRGEAKIIAPYSVKCAELAPRKDASPVRTMASKHRLQVVGRRLMTPRPPSCGLLFQRLLQLRVRACTSSNSRVFSMAMTAWSAKVSTSVDLARRERVRPCRGSAVRRQSAHLHAAAGRTAKCGRRWRTIAVADGRSGSFNRSCDVQRALLEDAAPGNGGSVGRDRHARHIIGNRLTIVANGRQLESAINETPHGRAIGLAQALRYSRNRIEHRLQLSG